MDTDQEKKNGSEQSHIRQTIMKRKGSKKAFFKKLILVCVLAAAAGAVAALVFASLLPVITNINKQTEQAERVTIAADDDPVTETAEESVSVTEEPVSEPEVTEEPQEEAEIVKKTSEQKFMPTPTPVYIPYELTVDEYIGLQDEMMDIAEEASRSVVTVTAITSQLDYFNQSVENEQTISGVIVAENDDSYFVLTESRIINNVERIQVTFNDGCIADAIFIKDDPDTGLAIIRVSASDLPQETKDAIVVCALGNSYYVETGDMVIAIGSPNGYIESVEFGRVTSTGTVISAVDCEYNLIATDIIGSDSGSGVLVNLKGAVVGIIDQSFSTTQSQIVTALSISQLKSLIEKLTNGEMRAYVGIKGREVTESINSITGIPRGVLVTEVCDDSPAMYAGITPLDVITGINEEKIVTMLQYKNTLYNLEPGSEVTITALRKGAEGYTEIEFTFEMGEI